MVDGLIGRIKSELGYAEDSKDVFVVATGGFCRLMKDISKQIDVIDPTLTLRGLRILYDRNVKSPDHA